MNSPTMLPQDPVHCRQDRHACYFTFTLLFITCSFRMCWHCTYIFWHIEVYFEMTLTCWRCVLMKQYSRWRKCVESKGKVYEILMRFYCGIVWNPLSILRKPLYFFQLWIHFLFNLLNMLNCSWVYVVFLFLWALLKCQLSTVFMVSNPCLDWFRWNSNLI